MRILSAPVLAALSKPLVPIAQLIELDLSSTVRLATCGWDLSWGGNTWLGSNGVGAIAVIDAAPGEVKGLTFGLSSVSSSMLAVALAEPLQGKAVTIYTAIFDDSSYQVLDAFVEWAGFLDVMSIQEQGDKAEISATAEHAGIDLIRVRLSKYTAQDQALIDPTDLGFQFVISQDGAPIVWPSASWYRR